MILPPDITFRDGYAFYTHSLRVGYDGPILEDRWETLAIRDGDCGEERVQAQIERLLEKTARELIRSGDRVRAYEKAGRALRERVSGRVRRRGERVP